MKQAVTSKLTASRLKELRKERGLTQEELAKKIGCNKLSVHKWESEKANISAVFVDAYASLFDVSSDYILGRIDYPGSYDGISYAPPSDRTREAMYNYLVSAGFSFENCGGVILAQSQIASLEDKTALPTILSENDLEHIIDLACDLVDRLVWHSLGIADVQRETFKSDSIKNYYFPVYDEKVGKWTAKQAAETL